MPTSRPVPLLWTVLVGLAFIDGAALIALALYQWVALPLSASWAAAAILMIPVMLLILPLADRVFATAKAGTDRDDTGYAIPDSGQ